MEAQKPPGGIFGEGLQRNIRFVDIFCASLTLFLKNFFGVNVVPQLALNFCLARISIGSV